MHVCTLQDACVHFNVCIFWQLLIVFKFVTGKKKNHRYVFWICFHFLSFSFLLWHYKLSKFSNSNMEMKMLRRFKCCKVWFFNANYEENPFKLVSKAKWVYAVLSLFVETHWYNGWRYAISVFFLFLFFFFFECFVLYGLNDVLEQS